MKKIFALAALSIFAAAATQAEVVDVSTIKCAEPAKMSKEKASYVLNWRHGYYGGKGGDTTIDLAAVKLVGAAIAQKCADNPDLGLMTATNQLAQ